MVMRIGIVSDTHGNLPAFQAVLEHMKTQNLDKRVHLGDIVGYGPYPNECVQLTVSNFEYIIMGNHDKAVNDPREAMTFNPIAKQAIEWTALELSDDNAITLAHLRSATKLDDILFIHGNPCSPFMYTTNSVDAQYGFSAPVSDFKISFVGHTHAPEIYAEREDGHYPKFYKLKFSAGFKEPTSCTTYWSEIGLDKRLIVNVGSVGQPRDNDPRACYVVYDTETAEITHFRIPYNLEKITGRMQQLGFDNRLWMRLLYGR